MQDALPHRLLEILARPLMELLLPLSNDKQDTAWDNTIAATDSFHAGTVNEFRLAVRIAISSIRANHFTVKAADPSLAPALSIRSAQCGLAYAKDADKAERQLEKLQSARMKEEQAHPAAPEAQESTTPPEDHAAQAEPATTPADATGAAAEDQPTAPADACAVQHGQPACRPVPPPPPIPAYKLRKQQRRLEKRIAKDARMLAQKAREPRRQEPGVPAAA
jgi:hypothetical protein